MLELTGLELRVAAACGAAQTLPKHEARALVARLDELVALLDRLAAAMTRNFGNLPQEGDVAPHSAAAAYGKGSGGRDRP
jgi:hypothetical protein